MRQKKSKLWTTTTLRPAVVCVKRLAIDPRRCMFPLRVSGAGRGRGLRPLLAHELNWPFVNDGRSERLSAPHRGLSEFHWTAELNDAVLAVLTEEMWVNLSR